jgi:MIP family channel proteins
MKYPCASCKKECLSELIGTFLLVFLGASSVIVAALVPQLTTTEALVFIAFTFGATVSFVILLLANYSGAVINPAITLGATLARVLHPRLLVPYLFFQITGGLLAGLILKIIFSPFPVSSSIELGSTELAKGVSPILGLVLETIGTFFLTISALIASTKIKDTRFKALLVGPTLFFSILFIGPLTGASFNPARSLGTSLVSGYFENLYTYILAPILGAFFAGLVFRRLGENGKRNLVCLC